MKNLPIVGVMGSGRTSHDDRALPLGQWLATMSVHLLTGGGGGVMQSVSRAFAAVDDRNGMVIGVVPGRLDDNDKTYQAHSGYPNPWIELAIFTHLPYSGEKGEDLMSRNHINVLSSNLIVVLPGQAGTAAEAALAVRYNVPVMAWLDHRSQIANLHPEIPVATQLGQIQEFVSQQLRKLNG